MAALRIMEEALRHVFDKSAQQALATAGVFGFCHSAFFVAGPRLAIREAPVVSSPALVRALCANRAFRCRDKVDSRCARTGPSWVARARAGRSFPTSRGILPVEAHPGYAAPPGARLSFRQARR